MSAQSTGQQHGVIPFPATDAIDKTHLTVPSGGEIPPQTMKNATAHVPDDPETSLHHVTIAKYLSTQLDTPLLDELYDHLWLVGRRRGDSIDALSKQRVRGRNIIPTEEPRLHMIWYGNKIYLKPVPRFLLNHEFWLWYMKENDDKTNSAQSSRSAARGFLRSYALLVRSQLDFKLAQEAFLIPDGIDWNSWSRFIAHFRHLDDDQVGRRYHFGQLQLTRLNWIVRIFRPSRAETIWFYELPHWSITQYISSATIPLLFLFASLSVVLSAMQVALSVPEDDVGFHGLQNGGLRNMLRAFWVFSILVMIFNAIAWALLFMIPFTVLVWQTQ